ncbi:bifunctional prephenate dehydrogenase/3-phosphoshikimate 1-carboxyvinyltransferase [Saccharophagus degradans]|uniref:3-phosphoshikimate 1-carboxyvinyltransferase n=1 Tax=Saccharophagus degradans TaxID=86304 RepID=A0AAW7X236_9GAMM|nr:bifunctional prephenate dehydrogenase/3-phosphoshikimate 1-carboxyvinyltransferase [Saccharophagus degradans]MBU2985806.1 bifunctional prephenate dehydrogenase/3-phosphoshikimate 1-carboxyvinyltransferase [Saccharophagus degradans]MDO6421043.1 bifunctional prephenate dehydrogenase/3-phosphoshikimate 1-carboxyvinyltransferase [Saccharophagus degradans]MDO6606046.1 bifunctional prephenate dehydrogenase/3-phosphoshikimate 1-carboxyvinyltransferase [Saccharophagus degradans]
MNTAPVINKLVVVGIGLIGGSLAAACKKRGVCSEVIGVARRAEVCERAVANGVVDRATTQISELAGELGEGDVVFIAVPTLTVKKVLAEIKSCLSPAVTITDGASVKGSVRDDVVAIYGGEPSQVVLGHPIAGSEKSGVDAADPELYVDHRIILTPLKGNGANHIERVTKMWQAVQAEVLEMDVDEHDAVLASTSHLPHAIAFSLVDTLAHDHQNENIFRYAAGGFRDFTRIASSDATMWRDIMLSNKPAVLSAIDMFVANLTRLRGMIEAEDATNITGVFTRAKAARDRFTNMLSHQAYSKTMQENAHSHIVYKVAPGGTVQGTIRVPGDKSISHRSIMLGSLAEGVTHVEGFLEGEDALATLQAFRDMGVVIEGPEDGRVTVHGVGLHGLQAPSGPLYVGNSGTSMRLLAGILAGQKFESELTGDESLTKRPMNRVALPLAEMGASIATANEGRPPLKIHGGAALKGINYDMPMASAQVKSCLLLAGLYAEGKTSVTEPAPTRDHTERMLRGFGYDVQRTGDTITVESGGKLTATDIDIPADISSATFFLVAAAITPGSDITLTHVGINPTRIGVINILNLMGANIELSNEREVGGEPVADIRLRYAPLKGIEVPESQVPLAIDEFPALMVAAACAEGTTVITGAEELRVKETDRIQAMIDGLTTLGIKCHATEDGAVIEGGQLGGGEVESFHDHRIAMSFTIAALRASGEITVNNCANVSTSFPNFTQLAKQVGISLEVIRS